MIGITSHYCVILKIVILHDAIKTIQNGIFPFSFKKQTRVKKNSWVGCFEKIEVFLNAGSNREAMVKIS